MVYGHAYGMLKNCLNECPTCLHSIDLWKCVLSESTIGSTGSQLRTESAVIDARWLTLASNSPVHECGDTAEVQGFSDIDSHVRDLICV